MTKAKDTDQAVEETGHTPEGFETLPGDPPVQSQPEPDQNDPAIWNPERIGEKGDQSDPDGRGGRVKEQDERGDERLTREDLEALAQEKREQHEQYGV